MLMPDEISRNDNPGTAKTTTNQEQLQTTPSTEPQSTAYTQADLDKAIAKALETREKNLKVQWEKEQEDKTKKAKLEAEKTKLEAEKKYEELYKMQIAELEKKEKELERNLVNVKVKEKFAEHKIPAEFEEYIMNASGSPQEAEVNAQLLKKKLDTYVDERIKEIQGAGISVKGTKTQNGTVQESIGKRLANMKPKSVDAKFFKTP
jgi:chromosome segregation ATPase